jgi:hypothetical protein
MRQRNSLSVSVAIAVFLGLAGCTGSAGSAGTTPPAPQGVEVRISPASAAVDPAGTAAFAAQVTGTATTAVTWSVQEANGGSVDPNGIYTAPTAPGTYHVVAASNAVPASQAIAEVTVRSAPAVSPVGVTVAPSESTLDACLGVVLTATVTNAPGTGVGWSVEEAGGGTVVNGLYTAPSVPGTYHVVATSAVDGSARGTATVIVGPARVLALAIAPGQAVLAADGAQTFAANVTTSCGTFAAQ